MPHLENSERGEAGRGGVALVLVTSGVAGFIIGAFVYPCAQVCVESAQILAGVVEYPPSNPHYICHVKLWTLLNQIPAIFLSLGVPEVWLRRAISGAVLALSFQALGLVVWVFSRGALFVLGSLVFIAATAATDFGVIYPIRLVPPMVHTYGMTGLSFVLLAIGLFGTGNRRAAGFLLGLSPAIHFSIALGGLAVAAPALCWNRRETRESLSPILTWFFAGIVLSGLSLAYQVSLWGDLPDLPTAVKQEYLSAYFRWWDFHRQPVRLLPFISSGFGSRRGICIAFLCLATAVMWLRTGSEDLSPGEALLLRMLILAGGVGLLLLPITHLQGRVPSIVNSLMPARFVNLAILAYPALLLGLLFRHRDRIIPQLILLVLAAWSLATVPEIVPSIPRRQDMVLPVMIGAGLGLLIWRWFVNREFWPRDRRYHRLRWGLSVLTAVCLIGLAGRQFVLTVNINDRVVDDWSNDNVFAAAQQGKGFLLTSSDLYMIQLQSRRPVLLNGGALDGAPYAPECLPEMNRILKSVYGVDLTNPPTADGLHRGALARNHGKRLWENRSEQEWKEIARKFGVSDIMTYSDWNLRLPLVVGSSKLKLYHIPID